MAITEAEAAIMSVLWEGSPRSAEDILRIVGPEREWQESTVKSLLSRLVQKDAIRATKDGRRFLYEPLITQKQYLTQESSTLLDRLFGGRVAPLVAHFSENQKLSKRDLAELRQLIERLDDERR